jgi:hypothetical protein
VRRAHLQDEGVDVVPVRREALAVRRREVGVAADGGGPEALEHREQPPHGVAEPLRVQYSHAALLVAAIPAAAAAKKTTQPARAVYNVDADDSR